MYAQWQSQICHILQIYDFFSFLTNHGGYVSKDAECLPDNIYPKSLLKGFAPTTAS